MGDLPLDIGKKLAGISLIPAPIEILGGQPELDDEVARQVFRLDLAPLFAPKTEERGLVVAHDDPGVRAANKVASSLCLTANSTHG